MTLKVAGTGCAVYLVVLFGLIVWGTIRHLRGDL